MKKSVFLFISIVFCSCTVIKVSYNSAQDTDFTKFKTYQLEEVQLTKQVQKLNHDLILETIEQEIAKEGFTKSDSADITVNAIVVGEQFEKTPMAAAYITFESYTEGTLIISFIDNSDNKILWQGIGSKTLNEGATAAKQQAMIEKVVKKIFKNYPPSK